MDKSSSVKKNITQTQARLDSLLASRHLFLGEAEGTRVSSTRQVRRRGRIFAGVFIVSLLITLFAHSNTLHAEIGSFRITVKDLDLLNLESLLNKHSPGVKYDGKISLSADIKFEEGVKTVSNGIFSLDKVSFSAENFLFPLEFSQLEGEFIANVKESLPAITGKIKSASVKWGRLSAQNLEADYSLYEKNIVITNGEIEIAGGTAYVRGDIDFGKNPAVFNLKLTTQGVDIGIISERWGYARPISGMLFADANLSGEFGKPAGISGKAKINIEKGELGKVGLIGRMLTFSPLAVMSRDFSLTTFEGDFDISEGYAYTENAVLKGPEIRITAKGDVGWNRKLNFILGLYASSELLRGTSLNRTLGTIIDDFGNVLRRIRLAGTIDNPAFTIVPLGIGGAIVEGLERSFGRGQQEGEDIR